MKKIALITVNYNGKKDTLALLESLTKLDTKSLELKTIVVDNGSDDGFVKEASDKYPEIDILQTGINLGFTGGYNRGIEHGLIWGADYIFIINNDALINSADLLTNLIKTAEKDSKIGVVSPKIYFAKGYEFHKNRYKESDLGKVIWYGGGDFDWDNIGSIHKGIDLVDDGTFDKVCQTSFISGCSMLIKREVLEKVGSFNDKYFAYFEDSDFCQRVKEAGFKLFYNGEVSIYHKVSQTAGIGSESADYYGARNRLIFGIDYASSRTKFALYRQALRLLLTGRPAQKSGIWDYFMGKTGPRTLQQFKDADYQIKLSIVSVNYNTPDLIDNLLKSIFKEESGFYKQSSEIIILDNGSEQGCKEVVAKYKEARFLQNEVNTGFTGGYNKSMKYSRGEYILMLNSDIEATKDSLSQITQEENDYKGNAIVSGSLYFPDGTLQDSTFYLPTITGAIKEYFLGLKGSFFMYAPTQEKNTRVEAAAMACFLIPRRILNKVGFLNEKLFTYFEDVDYCRRMKKLGIPVYYTPKARFIHHHGATGKRMKAGRSYEMLQRAAKIYYGLPYYQALSFVLRVSQKLSWVKTPVAR